MGIELQVLVNGLTNGCSYALVALGFALIYDATRFFHFAHGAVFTVAGFLTFGAVKLVGLPSSVSILVGLLGAGVVGTALELTIYRPLRRRGTSHLVLLLASLGSFIAIQNLVSLILGDDTRTLGSNIAEEGISVFGAHVTSIQLVTVLASLSLLCTTWALLRLTRLGRLIRALANDPELSLGVGIDVDWMVLLVFMLGSVLAGVAAVLTCYDTGFTPIMGFHAMLMAVVASIVGGTGSVPGVLAGALLVGFGRNLGVWWLPTQWQDSIVFAILILFLLLRPQGVLGKRVRKASV